MIERMAKFYCASCDPYYTFPPDTLYTHLLKDIFIRDGWRLVEDDVICPDCIATKEVVE